MPTVRFIRPFSAGSRPTPDPFDKFLDSHGFFRKHTARDESSLFRVVAEQIYDTQDHHEQVRKDCVNYMIKHRDQYESLVPGNFDQYMRQMAKPSTFGTLMELRAMGYLFKRNVILYRPFSLGVPFVDDPEYKDPVLRVFHASHFDSVFEKSFIVDAAFCQSIVYEMLYKKVFKLPDIEYSVETMLHSDINHEPSKHEYENGDAYATHIVFEDGRKFQLDRPENTQCILNDPERCHFHNQNFDEFAKRYEKSILSDKYNSCVRQLLFDGITPFPYKVAKSLDENIYRNIEFDSWNEARKTTRTKQYNFKVGTDCMVQLGESKDDLQKCRIQAKETDESYIVFIEKSGEKRVVARSSLRPVSGAQRDLASLRRCDQHDKDAYTHNGIHDIGFDTFTKKSHRKNPAADNFDIDYDAICKLDLETYINLTNFDFTPNAQQELIAYPMVYSQNNNMNTNNNSNNANNGSKAMKNRNQNHGNVPVEPNEKQQQVQIMKNEEDNSYGKNLHESKSNEQTSGPTSGGYYPHPSQDPNADANVPVTQQHMPNYYQQGPVYYCPTPEYNDQNLYPSEVVMPHGMYAIPAPYQAPMVQAGMYAPISGNQTTHYPVPLGGWSGYNPPMNPQGYVLSAPPHYALPAIPAPIPMQLPFLSRELLRSNGRINFAMNYSATPGGEDLPVNDKISMRFFYNLGIEYFKLLVSVHGYGALMAMIDGDNVGSNYEQSPPSEVDSQQNQITSDLQQLSFEPNDVDIQSPSKPRNYNDLYNRRAPNPKYKRNDNRPSGGKHFQGTFQGPMSKPFTKNNQKYMNNQPIINSYENTPMKDNNGGKQHQHGHVMSKRDQSGPDDMVSGNGGFGANVPPFPYYEQNELHYGPPGNVFPRITPPGTARPSSVPTAPYHHNQQMHGTYWLPAMPQGVHQPQSQQPQSQSHSLNTSGASIPSQ